MEACPDIHPVMTSCLEPFGILGTSLPPKSSFWATHRKDRRSHKQLGLGTTQTGLCTSAWCQWLSPEARSRPGHQSQNSLQLSSLLLPSYSWRHQGFAQAFISQHVDVKGLIHRKWVLRSCDQCCDTQRCFSPLEEAWFPSTRAGVLCTEEQVLLKDFNFKPSLSVLSSLALGWWCHWGSDEASTRQCIGSCHFIRCPGAFQQVLNNAECRRKGEVLRDLTSEPWLMMQQFAAKADSTNSKKDLSTPPRNIHLPGQDCRVVVFPKQE